jgi:hypothetical protein
MSVTLNGTSGLVFSDGTIQGTAGAMAFRNKIINGDMRIDQRLAGSALTVNTAGNTYFVDRWRANANGGGVFTAQRSTVAPPGFVNSTLVTVTTADTSVVSGDFYHIRQSIEGYNFADLNFGSATASAATLSFWVRSSVTGTYTVLLRNEAGARGYLTSYTINAANTWEYKTITIPGDTTGTWPTDNSSAAIVSFSFGNGSTRAANTWISDVAEGVSGQTMFISTVGATFYITGVQLEKAAAATSFEHRPIGTELLLCQRYFQVFGRAPALGTTLAGASVLTHITGQPQRIAVPNPHVEMRTAPSITPFNSAGTANNLTEFSSASNFTVSGIFGADTNGGGYIQLAANLINGMQYRATYNAEL